MKRALITGISGQDGAYLVQLLLAKGYEVFGAVRRTAGAFNPRLKELGIEDEVRPIDIELLEFSNICRVLETVAPDEVYNLAAQSFVGLSFEQPVFTADVDGLGVVRILEALRASRSGVRFYQASSSEMFGKVQETPQRETTPFYPRSPYGAAKLFGHWITVNYREAHDIYAVSGILFNHESPLRGRDFVTRRITIGLARVANGDFPSITLGNLNARRDWGFAGDYVEAMWRMLQNDAADDFVIATGRSTSVREFAAMAGAALGFDIAFEGEGVGERGIDRRTGRTIISVDKALFRPTEVDTLLGDSSKARAALGWRPSVGIAELAAMMAEADMRRIRSGEIAF
jgi:GDPmannose 4,6-dehydratase